MQTKPLAELVTIQICRTGKVFHEIPNNWCQALRPHPSDEEGFVLIEVIASLAILSFAIVAILQMSQTSASNQHIAGQKIIAALAARNTMERIGVTIPISVGTQTIELANSNRAVVSIEPWTSESELSTATLNDLSLYTVTVVVEKEGSPALSSLRAVKYAPAIQ